jgi:tetratricopeptide (TPR) repeat protein
MKLGRIASVALSCCLWFGTLGYAQGSVANMMDQAKREYRNGRYQAAMNELVRVTEEAPDRADAYYLIGYCHLMMRQYAESLDAFARAFQLDPELDPRTIYHPSPTPNEEPSTQASRLLSSRGDWG